MEARLRLPGGWPASDDVCAVSSRSTVAEFVAGHSIVISCNELEAIGLLLRKPAGTGNNNISFYRFTIDSNIEHSRVTAALEHQTVY